MAKLFNNPQRPLSTESVPEPPVNSARKQTTAGSLLRLLRPKQWTKNLLVFAALIFSGHFVQPFFLARAFAAFVAMCLVSSATYTFNDLADVERDRKHPTKRFRPIASGAVSHSAALAIGVVLLLGAVGIAAALNQACLGILAGYVALQVLYNVELKRVPVADVFCIAAGFVLRSVLGAAAIVVDISGWLLFCTGCLALMLGFAKRRHEFMLQGEARAGSRESLITYTRPALDGLVLMFATAAAICFGVYALESRTAARYPAIILTAPFVVYGITRYVLLVFTMDEGGEPAEILLGDRHLLITIALFLIAAVAALSGLPLPFLER